MKTRFSRLSLYVIPIAAFTLLLTGCSPKEAATDDADLRKNFGTGKIPPEYQKKMADGRAKAQADAAAKAQSGGGKPAVPAAPPGPAAAPR